MPDEPDARSRLLGKIQAGALPLDTPIKSWGDPGKGHLCDGCDQPILAFQIDYEILLPQGRLLHLHIGCFGVWEGARRRRTDWGEAR
jgi:hypothetical protein